MRCAPRDPRCPWPCGSPTRGIATRLQILALVCLAALSVTRLHAADSASLVPAPGVTTPAATNTAAPTALELPAPTESKNWNLHVQNTVIVQVHPAFPADYSGPNSLDSRSEVSETVSLDLILGRRLWPGAAFYVDGLMWQGFGFSRTLGIEGFPNGEAFRFGTKVPNLNFTRVFLRQTFGLGGEQEDIPEDALQLPDSLDICRLTLTVGRFSAKDIFDQNAYANDPRTQFMNWGFVANEAWDYPADSIGFITGLAVELKRRRWSLRYGFFQVPRSSNELAEDPAYLDAWAMVTEFERRFDIGEHPGAVRFLAYLNSAHMGSYAETIDNPAFRANIELTAAYRYKYGFTFNAEQEIAKYIGVFARLGWSDGRNQAWMYSDVDHTGSLGLSVNGALWHRPGDTVGLAGALNGISASHQAFLAAGGTGILAGDGALSYGWEQVLESFYDFQIWKTVHGAMGYQFINHPAFNLDRGPVSVFSARLHWEF
jgi:high affinity Mn2+ porin